MMLIGDCYLSPYGGGSYPQSGHSAVDAAARKRTLEDEILVLRSRMEQIFVQEKSFTSELVIEISCLLDRKINEYMRGAYH
ncbi:aspartyl-phosphate phosphatase Spo0E family protein [Paenibacillus sp. FSL R7-0273]|uniref:aspartyl-phosphate phosphatase Spo0E family protein n=1 Tax=Paenibacillus sp. FSL R7-0273 TaxID=1536772 RepID=UPI0009DDA0B1|nr:aspartyl-phosphate phosphatase Spo0E family protein [Paenibacillus sp. FSL R7-0273]